MSNPVTLAPGEILFRVVSARLDTPHMTCRGKPGSKQAKENPKAHDRRSLVKAHRGNTDIALVQARQPGNRSLEQEQAIVDKPKCH